MIEAIVVSNSSLLRKREIVVKNTLGTSRNKREKEKYRTVKPLIVGATADSKSYIILRLSSVCLCTKSEVLNQLCPIVRKFINVCSVHIAIFVVNPRPLWSSVVPLGPLSPPWSFLGPHLCSPLVHT